MKTTAADIAFEFLDRINSHDVALPGALVTDDHPFLDAQGNQLRGRREAVACLAVTQASLLRDDVNRYAGLRPNPA